ncbi:hypothetical protein [Gramella sp. AN32]|uniref:Glycosyltransferase n=1 Tax=Christiangramia antarctica TaxID=2058158 RepID=A0ABW5X7L2_9FLAO|nr:hypothetical protein [Gramella sp. AN32]MCM4154701.1 hypothetical protein [Gramella sp. AN32]
MKIFLPFKKDINPYLENTQKLSQHEYIYSNFRDYRVDFDIVNIHWPEAIFGWHEPSEAELAELKTAFSNWRKHSVLVYTLHDDKRHKGMTRNFKKLFQLVENYAEVFIHLGEYSKVIYQQKFPEAVHKTINHPLYEDAYPIYDKGVARDNLQIDQAAKVIIVPGNIRNDKEKKMVLRSFKSLKFENKVLIATGMRAELKFDFPGRVRLKKIIDVKEQKAKWFKEKYQPPEYYFSYKRISSRELGLKMSAADIVLIPRINNLNSGLFFLGLTYKKVLLGPEIGNIEEQLRKFNFPVFDPSSIRSIKMKIHEAFELSKSGYSWEEDKLNAYKVKEVVQELDKFMIKICNL